MHVEVALRPERTELAGRWRLDWGKLLLVGNLAALLVVAIALRAWRLGNIPGLNGDEAWSGVQALRWLSGQSIAWRTPTGNPANPFYLVPLALEHLCWAPSATLLRLPALASGLAALLANYWLCRRIFGQPLAWVSTLLLAVLPLNIAYSRFAWDASQSLLAVTLVMYFGLALVPRPASGSERLLAPLLAFGAAVWIHPTNVFAAWLLVVPLALGYRAEIQAALRHWRGSRTAWSLATGLVLAGLVAVWRFYPLAAAIFQRLVSPEQWGLFWRLLVRLFSGSTVLEFIAGPTTGSTALQTADLVLAGVALVGGWGLVRVLQSTGASRERCLALAWAAMLLTFYLVAGPAAIAPHAERYGVCLIAPGALLLARGLCYWLAGRDTAAQPAIVSRASAAALCAIAWLALAMFGWRYFGFIERTGGASHRAFRTAAAEPKQAAWQQIVQQSGGGPIWIVADEWWLYWPLAYLAAAEPRAHVVRSGDAAWSESTADPAAAIWHVAFCDTPEAQQFDERLAARRLTTGKSVICDYSGRPLLVIARARPETTDDYQSRSFDRPGR